ncbi:WXG100 family type VII secretion target [Nocardioides bruguierae]|uniref:ESAT-6-like protein n=1 Tax=Nocardioides bruguierae TaxID=2945102 RepID=A0A9X2IFP6_9ACTN|nr:WXG100 family type VII secretion target [Nocardioides bruguierae]MCL8025522.1 WXG100 family type VII secretion target [Nocardioides bruguierae]MCL8027409.1 WXG100 family type VII secretion target [Nocardioides bruguierae]MCM0620679.1 WXG100 family type VII secretion target [Nocardioides bruguierae]
MNDLDGIRVDHARLEGGSQDLARAVRDIQSRLAQLDGDLAALRGAWVGSARTAYDTAKAGWDEQVAGMHDLLARTSGAVAQANEDYRAADLRGAALFGA